MAEEVKDHKEPKKETEKKHEPTHSSKKWLSFTRADLKNRLGDVAHILGSDLFISIGAVSLPITIATSMAMGNPIPAIFSLLSTGIGTAIGWRGAGKSSSVLEKTGYLAAQAAATLAPLAASFGAPSEIVPSSKVASLLTTTFGMRHRTSGGHGGH